MISDGLVDPSPLISNVIPFENIRDAYTASMMPDNYRTILKF